MEGKEIIQLIRYQKSGEQTAITREIAAETQDEAIGVIKSELKQKLLNDLNDLIERGYKFNVIDTYYKDI